MPKYPQVVVQLTGQDGNAFFILGRVKQAMSRAKISKEEIDKCMEDMMSGDYDNLLATAMSYVTVK